MTRSSFLKILGLGSAAAWAGVRATVQVKYQRRTGIGKFSARGIQQVKFDFGSCPGFASASLNTSLVTFMPSGHRIKL